MNNVEIAPFAGRGRALAGFVVCGRWPNRTKEWAEVLTLIVRLAAVPGIVPQTTVFHTSEDKHRVSGDVQDAVGLMIVDGPIVGDGAIEPGAFSDRTPHAAMLLHPVGVGTDDEAASGCVLLPGVPHLGLGHRAVWVDAHADGTVTRLVARDDADVENDPDTAVLAMLLAA